jgi:hypothetical protein
MLSAGTLPNDKSISHFNPLESDHLVENVSQS